MYKEAEGASESVTVALSPAPSEGDTEVAVIYGFNTNSECNTLTVPSGWTEYDSTCISDGSNRHTIWTLTHVAGSDDTSYTFNVSYYNYLAAVVYDVSGAAASPVDAHEDGAFASGESAQATASLTPSNDYDLAIATWGNVNDADPTISTPFVLDANDYYNTTAGVTTAHYALPNAAALSATATYSSSPSAGGETNLILIAPTVSLQRPTLPTAALACSSGCIPGTGTALLLWGVETAVGNAVTNCPGWASSNCQAFNNVIINDCNSADPSVALYANTNSHETDFTHTASSGSPSNRYPYVGESTDCSDFGGNSNFTNSNLPLLNYAASQAATDVPDVVTSSYVPTGGIFSDDHYFDYSAPLASYEICDGCGHTWLAGGSADISILQNWADETNELYAYKVWLNSLSLPIGQTGGACSGSLVSGQCYGNAYNPGTYDDRVRLDELCDNLTGSNFVAIREEAALATDADPPVAWSNLGQQAAVLLDTVYDFRTLTGCKNAVLVIEEEDPWAVSWLEQDLAAFQAMAPSSDGTPDEIVQQPYSYCIEESCSGADTNIWPEQFIVPYGPSFSITPYTWEGTSAHTSTFCPGAGAPSSQQGDSGGIEPLVLTCVAQDQPVLAASYKHCYFLTYDLGACEWILNTGSSSATVSLSSSTYSYEVNFTGCEFGNGSSMGGGSTIATMFPWISSSSSLYSALEAAQSANASSSCDNGDITFSSTLPTSVAANSAVLVTAGEPSSAYQAEASSKRAQPKR